MMAKILVLYYSAYGHIETMAEAVAEGARSVGADVAAPDHGCAGFSEGRGQAGGLWVVKNHNVIGRDQGAQCVSGEGECRFVGRVFCRAERPVVTDRSVQPVVDALGDLVELWLAADHCPGSVAAGAPTTLPVSSGMASPYALASMTACTFLISQARQTLR